MVKTIIMSSGFNNVHKTPKTDFRYFIFISLATSSSSKGRNFLKFCKYFDTMTPPVIHGIKGLSHPLSLLIPVNAN